MPEANFKRAFGMERQQPLKHVPCCWQLPTCSGFVLDALGQLTHHGQPLNGNGINGPDLVVDKDAGQQHGQGENLCAVLSSLQDRKQYTEQQFT